MRLVRGPARRELLRSAACIALTIAAVAAAATQISADQRKLLEQKFPDAKIGEIRSTPVAGWLEIWLDGQPMYVSSDGRFLMNGRLLEIDTRTDLTRLTKARARAEEIAALDERDLVVYSPPSPKHVVTVFTDVSCDHCRQIQRDMGTLLGLGVKVRLVALPRLGPTSPAWRAMELAWCDSDRKSALERIMTEGSAALPDPARQTCTPNLVAQHFALAQRLHIAGTPTIIAPNGDILGGYLPPDELVRRLESL
jgi:thiol:disulfide interchange protein DsbC